MTPQWIQYYVNQHCLKILARLGELPVTCVSNLQKNSIRSYVAPVYRLQAECWRYSGSQ